MFISISFKREGQAFGTVGQLLGKAWNLWSYEGVWGAIGIQHNGHGRLKEKKLPMNCIA